MSDPDTTWLLFVFRDLGVVAQWHSIDAKPPLRSSEALPSTMAWPAGSYLSRLLETPHTAVVDPLSAR